MKYILSIVIIAFSTYSFACGGTEHHFSRYWRLDTVEKKSALLEHLGCVEPMNYSPRFADPVISAVLADAIKIGLPRKSIEMVLKNYNCAYGARTKEEYKAIRSYIGSDKYAAFCNLERLERVYIVNVSGGAVLRFGPSVESKRLAAVAEGAFVESIKDAEEWLQVKTNKGKGYVHKSLLSAY